ncbi:hypothetical protein ACRV61_003124 [Escherichia albertii]
MNDMSVTPVSSSPATDEREENTSTTQLTDEQQALMKACTQTMAFQFFADNIMGDTDDPANPMYQVEW